MDEISLQRLQYPPNLRPRDLHYFEARGLPELREAAAGFLHTVSGLQRVDAENLVVGVGAGSILESLAYNLFDPGDAVLIPAPYYSGYAHDLGTRFGVAIAAAPMAAEDEFRFDITVLEKGLRSAADAGLNPRALLVNSPVNPLGRLYSPAELEAMVGFCAHHGLHLIADEMYAHSVFDAGAGGFTSLLEIGAAYRSHIHLVYGIAKDLALSGFRVGFCYSENPQLLEGLKACALFYCVPAPVQLTVAHLLQDLDGCRAFIDENRRRLAAAYRHFQQQAEQQLDLQYLPSRAGHFVFVNLAPYLQSADAAGERALFERIFSEAGVNLTPGQYFGCEDPGWFRLCFAHQPAVVSEALKRLAKALQAWSL